MAFTQAVDAEGEVALCFNPKINYPVLQSTGVVGNVVTWGVAWSQNVSTNLPNTYATQYRPISMGVRIYNTLSAIDSAGYIVFAKGGRATVSTTTTFNPSNFSSYEAHPMKHGGEWHMVSAARGANAYSLKSPSDFNTTTSAGDDTWESLYLLVQGTKPSSVPLFIEVVWTVEYVPAEDAPIASMAVPQPVLNIGMQTAVNHVQSQHPAVHKGPTSSVKAFIAREGKKALVKHVIPFVAKKAVAALV